MKVTIHGTTDTEHLVERDKVNNFVEKNILLGQYFSIGSMYPDGWYEREYRKSSATKKPQPQILNK